MDNLAMDARKAAEAGLSYGQYVGLRFEKNGYKPMPRPEPVLEAGEVDKGYAVCQQCGKLFRRADRKNAKTCSDKCSAERSKRVAREKYRKKPVLTANCVICGREFPKTHRLKNTCSGECALERRKRVHKQWYEEHMKP